MDKRTLDELTRLHSNLTTFGAIIAVLEGGTVYGGVASENAASRIIGICKKEMERLVTRYDDLRASELVLTPAQRAASKAAGRSRL